MENRKELANDFQAQLRSSEEVQRMRYIPEIERLAREEGMLENARGDLILGLQTRFGEVPESVVEFINRIEDQSLLQTLLINAITTSSLEEFQIFLNEST